MGSSNWSDRAYTDRATARKLRGESTFAYTGKIEKGEVAAAAHESLDPKRMKAGKREARDSTEHPNSNPVFIGLDVTGSMRQVPSIIQGKLKELMKLLLIKGYLEDPAICVAGIGDAEMYDKAPFQVGQFESGIELENDLTNLYLEGGGGGNRQESYDLALYFLARMVETDAWEKRSKKGYAFIVCDEMLPRECKASSVREVFGITEQSNIPTETLLTEVFERWELYCIVPKMTAHFKTEYQDSWATALGERLLYLEDPSAISEMIASCIGVLEETVDTEGLVTDLRDAGLSETGTAAVTKALAKVGAGGALSKVTGGDTGLATL